MITPTVRDRRDESGVVLAVVLIFFLLLYAVVAAFQRRAVIDVTVSRNRENAEIAEALARGAARFGDAIVMQTVVQANMAALGGGQPEPTTLDQPWAQLSDVDIPTPVPDATVRIRIEDAGSRMDLNALAPAKVDPETGEVSSEAVEGAEAFMTAFLDKVIGEIREDAADTDAPVADDAYDAQALARALIDYLDSDEVDADGRYEDDAYRSLGGGAPANRPLLSVDELGMIPGYDHTLVEAIRPYVTVYPLDGRSGINLNTAPAWVLALVYYGPSGERQLANEDIVGDILKVRKDGRILCARMEVDPDRCVALTDVGLGEGSLFSGGDAPVSARVFRVVGEATVGEVTRRFEAVYDYSEMFEPRTLSFRPLQGSD